MLVELHLHSGGSYRLAPEAGHAAADILSGWLSELSDVSLRQTMKLNEEILRKALGLKLLAERRYLRTLSHFIEPRSTFCKVAHPPALRGTTRAWRAEIRFLSVSLRRFSLGEARLEACERRPEPVRQGSGRIDD